MHRGPISAVCAITLGLALAVGASAATSAETNTIEATLTVVVKVPGTANPDYAGRTGTNNNGTVPVLVPAALRPGSALRFRVSGGASHTSTCCHPLDGWNRVTSMRPIKPATGIAGMQGGRYGALLGVFLDAKTPTPPDPAWLDFRAGALGTSFKTLRPGLNQMFYIGDGLTGAGTGTRQRFIVPRGAKRLFLAVHDGYGWYNNTGVITATVLGL